LLDWCQPPIDLRVVRGLAYYTGIVFEVHEISGGERALAGGGRYDNLIELFGGPSTPAVGFGMGDVVLSLVLQDNKLLPADEVMLERAGLRPDVFVISNGTPEADAALQPMLAFLRRAGLHARRTGKTTQNIGKLLQDASGQRARVALIIESDQLGQIKDMTSGAQAAISLRDILPALAALGVRPH
jgi:histidyl-tRNA synthetase